MKKLEYTVYSESYILTMQGDRVENARERDEADEHGTYSTMAEAVAEAERLASDPGNVKLHSTRRGVGSIEHVEIYVSAFFYDEEDDEWKVCDENGEQDRWGCAEPVWCRDTLHDRPELQAAWDKAVKQYHAYLDYEDDEFFSVASYMDSEDDDE